LKHKSRLAVGIFGLTVFPT